MKIAIHLDSGDRAGTPQVFRGNRVIRLGRHGDNDCVFDDAKARTVSGFHAEIHLVGRNIVIVDNHSTNGVLVNGQWAERTALSSGDTVELGKDGPSFKVMIESEPTDPPPRPPGSDIGAVAPEVLSEPPKDKDALDSNNSFRPYPVSRGNTLFPHASRPAPPDEEETSPKKYGERTVGMMVKQALAEAGLGRLVGTSKSTDYFEAMVDQKVRSTSSRLKKGIFFSVVIVFLASAAAAYYFYRTRRVEVYQTTQSFEGSSGQSIAAQNRFAIYMLAGKERIAGNQSGSLQGFCTAFAVTQDVMATNAHCVSLAKEKYTGLVAIMNGAPGNTFWISSTIIHPGYVAGRLSPDVGLVRVRGQLPHLVNIGSATELGQVAPGATMFLYGFPGRLNREDAPEATFVKGDIGRVTTFQQKLGNFGQNTLLQHSAFSSPGTSGSPIFNASGHVIGINAGGYVEDGKALSGYNFAMRIDLINELLPVIRNQ